MKMNAKKPAKIKMLSSNYSQNLYDTASYIVGEVNAKRSQPQKLVYDTSNVNKRALLAVVMKTLQFQNVIDAIIADQKLLEVCQNEDKLRIWVGQILLAEKHLANINDPEFKEILKRKKTLCGLYKEFNGQEVKEVQLLPKYARVNTILYTVKQAIGELKKDGFVQLTWNKTSLKYNSYLDLVRSLKMNQFVTDFHFPDILVFCPKQPLYKSHLVKNGFVLISDKASYIPVHLLKPKPGSVVVDACAAPGMKTLHIAAMMKNTGKLLSFEYDQIRFKTLQKQVGLGGATCCKTQLFDFLHINTTLKTYENVEYILVDPSCSGSGMINRFENQNLSNQNNGNLKSRLFNLKAFQTLILRRALQFPNVKRVVYSTCSIHVEENESVVEEVLACFPGKFQVVNAFPQWPERGSSSFEFGLRCVKTNINHLTNGFFVAVFERVGWTPDITEMPEESAELPAKKRKLKKKQIEADPPQKRIKIENNTEPIVCQIAVANAKEVSKTAQFKEGFFPKLIISQRVTGIKKTKHIKDDNRIKHKLPKPTYNIKCAVMKSKKKLKKSRPSFLMNQFLIESSEEKKNGFSSRGDKST